MNILLISIYAEEAYQEDIGICCIASYLRTKGENVKLIGKPYKSFEYNEIVEFQPDVIGFSLYNDYLEYAKIVINKLHELIPNAVYFAGGATTTFYYEELLKFDNFVDYAILGAGEEPSYLLIQHLKGKIQQNEIPNCAYIQKGEIIKNEATSKPISPDDLPYPARDIYEQNQFDSLAISTSRGCVKRCSFCCTNKFWGGWKGGCVDRSIEEIKYLLKKYGNKNIYFIDGSIEDPYQDARRLRELAEKIIKEKLDIFYYVLMRAETHEVLDKDFIQLLKTSGLTIAFLGIESGNNQDLLEIYNKSASVETNNKAIDFFKKNNIVVSTGFININPYSNKEKLKTNIDWLYKHNYACFMQRINSRLKLYRGTKIYDKLLQDKLIVDEASFDNYNYRIIDNEIAQINSFLLQAVNKKSEIYYFDEIYRQWVFIYAKCFAHINKYEHTEKQILSDRIEKYQAEIDALLSKINDINYNWFCDLLNIPNDMNFNKIAWDHYNEFLHEKDFKEVNKIIQSYKFKAIVDLKKIMKINII